jgi:hypothetical protein
MSSPMTDLRTSCEASAIPYNPIGFEIDDVALSSGHEAISRAGQIKENKLAVHKRT